MFLHGLPLAAGGLSGDEKHAPVGSGGLGRTIWHDFGIVLDAGSPEGRSGRKGGDLGGVPGDIGRSQTTSCGVFIPDETEIREPGDGRFPQVDDSRARQLWTLRAGGEATSSNGGPVFQHPRFPRPLGGPGICVDAANPKIIEATKGWAKSVRGWMGRRTVHGIRIRSSKRPKDGNRLMLRGSGASLVDDRFVD